MEEWRNVRGRLTRTKSGGAVHPNCGSVRHLPSDHAALVHEAEKAARAAGAELLSRPVGWLTLISDEGHDVKLAADRRSEAVLARLLASTGLPIFSEESGWIGERDESTEYWLVDPLDGTANYSCGIPLCCVSVALMSDDRPVAGVVYDFNRDEMFVGGRGLRATLGGSPIRVSTKRAKAAAILSTGLTVRGDYSDRAMNKFAHDMAQWKKVRMIGTAALSLAYVACGRFDAYREQAIMLWDVAAGWALVEAAGGVVRTSAAKVSTPTDVFASNPALCAAVDVD
jgi:myo-inositol-1(or 4)-monophosphatase